MRYLSRIIVATVIGFLLVPLLVNSAHAHLFAPSLLKVVETTQQNYNVVWKTPSKTSSNTPLVPTWPDSCELESESPVLREGTATISSWTLRCDQLGDKGLIGQVLGVTGLAENQASSLLMLNLRDGRHYQRVLNGDSSEFIVPQSPSQTKVMTEYPLLGIEHIWGGLDHLMFVFGLLLLVGGGAQLLWTITAFTVGHSITLAIVTLGLLAYPVALIEFTIALSIFILALELTRNYTANSKRGLFGRYPKWVAGGFGLLHGMGFAGALVEIGLPQSNVPLALLFFNIGIEVGQIMFLFLVLSLWWSIKRVMLRQDVISDGRLLFIPVYILGGLSAMWCIERGLYLIS